MNDDKNTDCRLMPHGAIILFPIVIATLGLCAALVDDGCDFARVSGASVEMLTGSSIVPFIDSGMSAYRVPGYYPAEKSWRVVYSDECQPYQYMEILADTPWLAAKLLRFLALVLGGTTTTLLWTSTCLILQPNYWRAAGVGILLACMCQLSSFVWFYTKICHTTATSYQDFEAGIEVKLNPRIQVPSSCTLFFGSKCAIASCVLLGVSSVLILFIYPPPIPKLVVHDEDIAMIVKHERESTGGQRRRKKGTDEGGASSSFNLEKLLTSISAAKLSVSSNLAPSASGHKQENPRASSRQSATRQSFSSTFSDIHKQENPRASSRQSASRQSFSSTFSEMTFA